MKSDYVPLFQVTAKQIKINSLFCFLDLNDFGLTPFTGVRKGKELRGTIL